MLSGFCPWTEYTIKYGGENLKKEKDYGKWSYIKATYTLILFIIMFAVSCYLFVFYNPIMKQTTHTLVLESLCLIFLFGLLIYSIYSWFIIKKTAKTEYTEYDREDMKKTVKQYRFFIPLAVVMFAISLYDLITGEFYIIPLQQFSVILWSFCILDSLIDVLFISKIKKEI